MAVPQPPPPLQVPSPLKRNPSEVLQMRAPPPPPPPAIGKSFSEKKKTLGPATVPKGPATSASPAKSPERCRQPERIHNYSLKLKPLHWDKVRPSSNQAMAWDLLKCGSYRLNEEMIESLFVYNTSNSATGLADGQAEQRSFHENRVLNSKKAQNIAILLRALNITKEEVCEALIEGNADSLGSELLETLTKMAPSKEEELKLREYKDDGLCKLGLAEGFLKAVLSVPFAFKRVDAMLYVANFDPEVTYLMHSFGTLEVACKELKSSRMFLKLLEAVLKTGNRMNVGTYRGDAKAFKLDTLLKLVDIKGSDGKTSLLHFVVQEIARAEGVRLSVVNVLTNVSKELTDDIESQKLGLQTVSGLSTELSNVKKAAVIDSDVISGNVSKLVRGVGKVREVLQVHDKVRLAESNVQFCHSMNGFLKKAEDEVVKVQAQESRAMSMVKEITEYFHGNSAKEEAHPFRIFAVIRDFLAVLDQVCKETTRMYEQAAASPTRRLELHANNMLPQLFNRSGSSDSESSSSSSSSSSKY